MSTENSGDQRPVRLSTMTTRPAEAEHLPCPRCDSINTKFCYYNNYNLSQPRHFCKSCRRYWTRGGTLRNVPVGGGSRKSSSSSSSATKRARPNPNSPTSATSSCSRDMAHHEPPPLPLDAKIPTASFVFKMDTGSGHMTGCDVNLNEAPFLTTTTTTAQVGPTGGYLPYGGGFGLGTGPGLHGMGFGLGMMDWPMEAFGHGNGSLGGGSGVEGGLGDGGDCFGWPELAISMPGKGLK